MNSNDTQHAVQFGAATGNIITRLFGPLLTWFGFAILAGHPFGLIAYVLAGAWWWLRGPRHAPWNSLSRGWKINLYAHAGCGSSGAGLAILLYYAPAALRNGGALGVIATILQSLFGVALLGYSLWYWLRVHRHIRPVFEESEPAISLETALQIAGIAASASSGLASLDHVSSSSSESTSTGSGARTFHDGSGRRIEINEAGNVYIAGKFIGHRDAQGRITDGSGKFTGTIRDDGGVHGANGDYLGRFF